MKKLDPLIIILFFSICFLGCTTVKYLEQESPPGQVPPPKSQIPPLQSSHPSDPLVNKTVNNTTTSQPIQKSQLGSEIQKDFTQHEMAEGIIKRFSNAYNSINKPKIAVFLNRQLSDEVREWVTDSRIVLSGDYSESVVDGKNNKKNDSSFGVSGYTQQHAELESRPNPNERWMWAFEDGFIQPFLQSGAKIVDRSTIMRLTAASKSHQESAYAPTEVRQIEMEALKGCADLFIEILISRSPSSLYGYEFKASAKEVNTGIIIANVTSLRWHPEERTQREVYATSHGYELVDTIIIPPVEDIAADLSIDLMNGLLRVWEK